MKAFEDRIRVYLAERDWDRLRPADLAKSVVIEGAELLELFQWENLEPERVRENAELMAKIRGELADVMIYCFDMAVILGIDVEAMLADKLAKVERKYPPDVFNAGNRTGEPGTEPQYHEAKRAHREKCL